MIDRKAIEEKFPFAFDPDPDIPQVDPEGFLAAGVPAAEVVELLGARNAALAPRRPKTPANPVGDPLRYGYRPPSWERAERVLAEMRRENPSGVLSLLIMGAFRSSKTEYGAWKFMHTLLGHPGSRGWFMQEKEDASKQRQQPRLWDYFPSEFKNESTGKEKRRVDVKISYKQGDGFSSNQFVLPAYGKKGATEAVGQWYQMDPKGLQGDEILICWADELLRPEHMRTARQRLFQMNGLLVSTFVPIDGYTDTVSAWLDGVEFVNGIPQGYPCGSGPDGKALYTGVTEWAEAKLLPKRAEDGTVTYERVPLVLRCRDGLSAVVWFHNDENPWGNYAGLVQLLSKAGRAQILVDAYGIPTKKFGSVFQFREDRNVVPPAGREALLAKKEDWTFYMVMDPAGTSVARNPFMTWWAVNAKGQKVCVREWPQPEDYIPAPEGCLDAIGSESGVWALSGGKADGTRGPGQEWFGFGFKGLAEEIRRVEKEMGITVRERYADSRAANTETMTTGGATTIINEFEELDDPLYFEPASGRQVTETGEAWKLAVQARLEASDYLGAPELMICSCCQNTIHAMKAWTGVDKDHGACKDPVDTVKYIVLEDIQHRPMVKTGAGMVAPPRSYAPRKRK